MAKTAQVMKNVLALARDRRPGRLYLRPAGADPSVCRQPSQARPSLEAVGIDVEKACEAAGLPAGFVPGQVTLTGLCSFIDLHTPARLRV